MAARLNLRIEEGDDAFKEFAVTVRKTDGTKAPYDFTDAELEIIVKTGPAIPDDQALYRYASELNDGSVTFTDRANGKFGVQWARADTAEPGNFFYKVRVEKEGLRETIMKGTLIVGDA